MPSGFVLAYRHAKLVERFDDLALNDLLRDAGLATHEDGELHLRDGVLLLQDP